MLKSFVFLFATILLLSCASSKAPDERKGRLLVGVYSTRTFISVTTLTSSASYTCHNGINPVACKRRRRRRSLVKSSIDDIAHADESEISSSIGVGEDGKDVVEPETKSHRTGKLRIVFWSTNTSYLTVITTTTPSSAISFSVSFYCSVAGVVYPPTCG